MSLHYSFSKEHWELTPTSVNFVANICQEWQIILPVYQISTDGVASKPVDSKMNRQLDTKLTVIGYSIVQKDQLVPKPHTDLW